MVSGQVTRSHEERLRDCAVEVVTLRRESKETTHQPAKRKLSTCSRKLLQSHRKPKKHAKTRSIPLCDRKLQCVIRVLIVGVSMLLSLRVRTALSELDRVEVTRRLWHRRWLGSWPSRLSTLDSTTGICTT